MLFYEPRGEGEIVNEWSVGCKLAIAWAVESSTLGPKKKILKEKKSSHRLELRPTSHGPPTLLASDMTVCIKFNFTGQLGKDMKRKERFFVKLIINQYN